jgi:hypothetical protein
MWRASHHQAGSGSHRARWGVTGVASIAVLALLAPATAWGQEEVEQVEVVEQIEVVVPEVTTPAVIIVPAPLEVVPPPVTVGQPVVTVAQPPVVAPQPIIVAPQPIAVAPQPIVVASGGLTGETTEVVIRSVEGEPSLPISVEHTGPAPDPDEDGYDRLCMTPCMLQLPPGEYELLAGDHRTFEIIANGGTQEWEVEDDSLAGIIAGATLTFVGPLAIALPGMGLLTIDWGDYEHSRALGYSFIGVGAALGVLGMLLWVESTGASDLVSSSDDDSPVLGLNLGDTVLVPSIAVAPDDQGNLAFGLGFALTL